MDFQSMKLIIKQYILAGNKDLLKLIFLLHFKVDNKINDRNIAKMKSLMWSSDILIKHNEYNIWVIPKLIPPLISKVFLACGFL